jgi:thioredoxin 1
MGSEKMVQITDVNFNTEVEKSNGPVLVDFGATWCGPCKILSATLGSMMGGYQDRVKFCYVDIQQAPATSQKFGIQSVPTLVLFNNGAPAGSLLGAQPQNKIEALLRTVL